MLMLHSAGPHFVPGKATFTLYSVTLPVSSTSLGGLRYYYEIVPSAKAASPCVPYKTLYALGGSGARGTVNPATPTDALLILNSNLAERGGVPQKAGWTSDATGPSSYTSTCSIDASGNLTFAGASTQDCQQIITGSTITVNGVASTITMSRSGATRTFTVPLGTPTCSAQFYTLYHSDTAPFGLDNWPFLTILPQIGPTGFSGHSFEEMPVMLDMIRADVEARHNCDPLRRYITGLSLGSYIAYSYAARNPTVFAGVLICSGAIYDNTVKQVGPVGYVSNTGDNNATARAAVAAALAGGNVRLWNYHGSLDSNVPVADYDLDHTALTAAYASAGISSQYTGSKDEATMLAYGGETWDHALCWERVYSFASTWTTLAGIHR